MTHGIAATRDEYRAIESLEARRRELGRDIELLKLQCGLRPRQLTMSEEQVQDFQSICSFHEAINHRASLEIVHHLLMETLNEIERTHALYLLEMIDGNG